jgi:hypothetical protein
VAADVRRARSVRLTPAWAKESIHLKPDSVLSCCGLSGSAEQSLRDLLLTLTPSAREHLRSVLIHDQADRDAISSRLMRYRDERGDDWADIIDMLTMYPEERRRVVRLLGEIEADATFLILALSILCSPMCG